MTGQLGAVGICQHCRASSIEIDMKGGRGLLGAIRALHGPEHIGKRCSEMGEHAPYQVLWIRATHLPSPRRKGSHELDHANEFQMKECISSFPRCGFNSDAAYLSYLAESGRGGEVSFVRDLLNSVFVAAEGKMNSMHIFYALHREVERIKNGRSQASDVHNNEQGTNVCPKGSEMRRGIMFSNISDEYDTILVMNPQRVFLSSRRFPDVLIPGTAITARTIFPGTRIIVVSRDEMDIREHAEAGFETLLSDFESVPYQTIYGRTLAVTSTTGSRTMQLLVRDQVLSKFGTVVTEIRLTDNKKRRLSEPFSVFEGFDHTELWRKTEGTGLAVILVNEKPLNTAVTLE